MEKTAKNTALQFLKYRSRSESEIMIHLRKKGFPDSEVHETVSFLRDCGLTDDGNFCREWISASIDNGKGPLRIRQELAEKGLNKEMVQELLEELYSPELERENAMRQGQKRLPRETEPQDKDWNAMIRRLAYLGYRTSVVFEVMSSLRRKFSQDDLSLDEALDGLEWKD